MEVAVCGSYVVWDLRCVGVAVSRNCGVRELHRAGVAVCGGTVSGSCCVWELQCVGVAVCVVVVVVDF